MSNKAYFIWPVAHQFVSSDTLILFLLDIEIDGSFKSNLNAQIQAKLSLTCPINGVPTPTYSWSKDGKTISDKKTLSLSLKDKNQFGLYECKGVNVVGTRKVEYRITEICKYELFSFNCI